jgi:UDP-GlcNAc:undecaprenyl-phosphate GlcNAc-1-phosphate transferase
LIGFFIASMSVFTSNKGTVVASLLVVIVALGVPILDTLFTIVRRAVRGVPIFRGDAEHIHHRLITLGFSKTQALAAMYSICLVLSLIGISIFWTRGFSLPIAGAALFLLGLGAARYLGYVQSWRDIGGQLRKALERRQEMLYCGTYADMLEWEAERCHSAQEFLPLLRLGVERMGFHLEAGEGRVEVKMILDANKEMKLFRATEGEPERWHAKADLLVPALKLATQRWGQLPGVDEISRGQNLPSSPTDTTTC